MIDGTVAFPLIVAGPHTRPVLLSEIFSVKYIPTTNRAEQSFIEKPAQLCQFNGYLNVLEQC